MSPYLPAWDPVQTLCSPGRSASGLSVKQQCTSYSAPRGVKLCRGSEQRGGLVVKSRGKGSAICLVHPNGRRKHHLSTLDRLVLWRVSCCKSIRSTIFFFILLKRVIRRTMFGQPKTRRDCPPPKYDLNASGGLEWPSKPLCQLKIYARSVTRFLKRIAWISSELLNGATAANQRVFLRWTVFFSIILQQESPTWDVSGHRRTAASNLLPVHQRTQMSGTVVNP